MNRKIYHTSPGAGSTSLSRAWLPTNPSFTSVLSSGTCNQHDKIV